MPAYSFCMLDPVGMTQDFFVKVFGTDDAARESVAKLVSRFGRVEIWDGRRLVGRFASRSDASETRAVAPMRWSAAHVPATALAGSAA